MLLVLNKCDAPVTVSKAEVELVMSLSELQSACQVRGWNLRWGYAKAI